MRRRLERVGFALIEAGSKMLILAGFDLIEGHDLEAGGYDGEPQFEKRSFVFTRQNPN